MHWKLWPTRRREVKIELVLGDITLQSADVIVNAAKSSLLGGGGVDGAIHRAGGMRILEECRALRRTPALASGLPVGEAVATTAGWLDATWVVHTVGPYYEGPEAARPDLLRSCYSTSLALAAALGAKTVAFPLISSGVYRWPAEDAIRQAIAGLRAQKTTVKTARLVIFGEAAYQLACEILEDAQR